MSIEEKVRDPKAYTTLSVRIYPEDREDFKKLCRITGYTPSTLVRRLIKEWMVKAKKEAQETGLM